MSTLTTATALAFLAPLEPASVLGCYQPDQCHRLSVRDGWVEFESFLGKKPARIGRFAERYAGLVDSKELPTSARRLSADLWLVTAWGFARGVELPGPAFSAYLFDNSGRRLLAISGDLRLVDAETISMRGVPMLVIVSASSKGWTYITNIVSLRPRPALVYRSGAGRAKIDPARQASGIIDIEAPVLEDTPGPIAKPRLLSLTWDGSRSEFVQR